MPRRVEMSGVVGREPDPFDRPAFAIGQVFLGEAGKEFHHVGGGLAMGVILDRRAIAGRVSRDVILQRHRNVDQSARHDACSSPVVGLNPIIDDGR